MKLGFSTWGMPQVPIDVALSHLATLGFDAVEVVVLPRFTTALDQLDGPARRRIGRLLADLPLQLSALNYYTSLLDPAPDRFDQLVTRLREVMELAALWMDGDTPVVITGIGGQPGELPARLPQLAERLALLGEAAQELGAILALEPHVGTAVETPDQMLALLAQVDSPAVRVNFDISHFNVMGIPLEESVARMLPHAVHTHVKDERGRVPDYEYVIPGEGEFDYVAYLRCMAAHGYRGVISVEISNMVQRRPDYEPLEVASRSYQVLARAFQQAGIARGTPSTGA
ncbi:sugar phosphate isomerase/epimerase [Litorilinea aerophila]|uniref:Sugar phosphate isomerase/epimerase n=1 Tax=Litorilinea aerophila TaxID=1204385 RepID=A0A540VLJ3_9CHLR|nr:sugar phosphate isomerase/epimerase [Litorilinea aerophila]MCC9074857.1 sugar phosphate isomerase/epimerase [Litorilinea aerophila]